MTIRITVESGANFTETTNAIKQRVDAVRNLPTDAETPTIEQFVMRENVGTILITTDGPVDELTSLARQAERELLAKGISKIEFLGLPKQEIAIQVKPSTMNDLGLSLRSIAGLINNQSQDVMAGTAGVQMVQNSYAPLGKCQTSTALNSFHCLLKIMLSSFALVM